MILLWWPLENAMFFLREEILLRQNKISVQRCTRFEEMKLPKMVNSVSNEKKIVEKNWVQ